MSLHSSDPDVRPQEIRHKLQEPIRFPVGLKQVTSNARLPRGANLTHWVLSIASGFAISYAIYYTIELKPYAKPYVPVALRTNPKTYQKDFLVDKDEPVLLVSTGGYDPYTPNNFSMERRLPRKQPE
ncbi:hypothetical protein BV898_07031 [Hypsibius exemplaris]|uniref:Uncharacterized protein n=1 Tax=Hypsibius exemplaris TaxID=2072580 RepID=A0A1W0WUV0_HYPEX|nr:hypothetical protein BV898_07031 [Hypsibius exemplaris]